MSLLSLNSLPFLLVVDGMVFFCIVCSATCLVCGF